MRRATLAEVPLTGLSFGHMELADEFVHVTADGRRLLVIHGDCFDHLTRHAPWLYHLGDRAYTFALHANAWVNSARRLLGYPYWSLSAMLKPVFYSLKNEVLAPQGFTSTKNRRGTMRHGFRHRS
jgi:UDP-2,3-diacylglucosamine pyrophosphatase LpxH